MSNGHDGNRWRPAVLRELQARRLENPFATTHQGMVGTFEEQAVSIAIGNRYWCDTRCAICRLMPVHLLGAAAGQQ